MDVNTPLLDFTFLQAQLVYDHLNEVSFGLLGLVF